MNRFYYLVILVLVTLTVWASPASAIADNVYPHGINGPSAVQHGVYGSSDAAGCCWIGKSAEFTVAVPSGADTAVFAVFIPDYAAPPEGQAFRVRLGNSSWQERCCFGRGMHEIPIALTHALPQDHSLRVQFQARYTFVPARRGLNNDPRELSALLRGVRFVDVKGGTLGDDGVETAFPPAVSIPVLVFGALLTLGVTLRRPIWGVAALIVTDPFLFAYGVHGTTLTLPKLALIAVAAGVLVRRPWQHITRPTTLVLLLAAQGVFIGTMVAAGSAAEHLGPALRETLKAAQFAATLVTAYCAYLADPDETAVRWTLSATTLLVTALAVGQAFWHPVQSELIAGHAIARLAGPLEGPNQLAGFLGITVPAILAFALFRKPLRIEPIAAAIGILACVLTFSRGGVAALLLGLAVLLIVRYAPHFKRIALVSAVAVLVAGLGVSLAVAAGNVSGPAAAVFGGNTADRFNGGLGSRIDLWHGAYQIWESKPIAGIGPGNYEIEISQYDPGVRTHANSMYLNVLAEQGVLGFIALLALVAVSILAFARRLSEPLILAAFTVACVMALHQIVDSMLLYQKVGVIWWVVIALGAARADQFA